MYKNVYNKHLFRLNGGKLQPIIDLKRTRNETKRYIY